MRARSFYMPHNAPEPASPAWRSCCSSVTVVVEWLAAPRVRNLGHLGGGAISGRGGLLITGSSTMAILQRTKDGEGAGQTFEGCGPLKPGACRHCFRA